LKCIASRAVLPNAEIQHFTVALSHIIILITPETNSAHSNNAISISDARQKSSEKGNNWLNKIKQELEGLGMGDIWINGEENNRNVWRGISKRDRIWKPV
jgi:hypothetical protein